jgi:hypothetical protein
MQVSINELGKRGGAKFSIAYRIALGSSFKSVVRHRPQICFASTQKSAAEAS